MKLTIVVDVDIEESGLDEFKIKDNIIDFAKDLIIVGAAEQEIGIILKEVSYENWYLYRKNKVTKLSVGVWR